MKQSVLILCCIFQLFATNLHITVVVDDTLPPFVKLEEAVKNETAMLLSSKKEIIWHTVSLKELKDNLQKVYEGKSNIVLTLGPVASNKVIAFEKLTKPTIAINPMIDALKLIPSKEVHKSGMSNFTYVAPPLNLREDLQMFASMFSLKRIALVAPKTPESKENEISTYLKSLHQSIDTIIQVDEDSDSLLAILKREFELKGIADGVYILPLLNLKDVEIESLLTSFTELDIPTFTTIGSPYLTLGATASFAPDLHMTQISRRVAITIMKASQGVPLANLPVKLMTEAERLQINMKNLREIEQFPSWDIMNKATLLNIDEYPTKNSLTLQSAIQRALDNNQSLKATQQDVSISQKEISLAKSAYLPQLQATAKGVALNDNIVESSMGQQGRITATGSMQLSQQIFSEPAHANIAIAKLMSESTTLEEKQHKLDLIQQVSLAYCRVLMAKSAVSVHNNNLTFVRENLSVAETKASAGEVTSAEVNRWLSEESMKTIALQDAMTQLQEAHYSLNQLCNIPLSQRYSVSEKDLQTDILFSDRIFLDSLMHSSQLHRKLSDLFVEKTKSLPAVEKVALAQKAQERLQKSHKRAFYIPTVIAAVEGDLLFHREGELSAPGLPTPRTEPGLSAVLSVNYPLFKRNQRALNIQKTNMEISKLHHTQDELLSQLELQLRSSLDKARTSYLAVSLSQQAAASAKANYEQSNEAYRIGAIGITDLLEAQQAYFASSQGVYTAMYRFLTTYIAANRLTGEFLYLKPKQEQNQFLQQIKASIN